MFRSSALLPLLLVALSASASPILVERSKVTIPFARKFNFTAANIVEADRARIAAIKSGSFYGHGKRANTPVSIANTGVSYTATVGVGSPATDYTLLIDTGSSNTWVGADKSYTTTSSSKNTGNSVKCCLWGLQSVSYGSGSFSGKEYIDTVTLGPGLTIASQSIGVGSVSSGFRSGVDGILGIGPTALTEDQFNLDFIFKLKYEFFRHTHIAGTVNNTDTVPTVIDNLKSAGTIDTASVGIYFAPTNSTSDSDANGELSFGGPDPSKYTGTLHYVDVTFTSPASEYWGINQTITYNGKTILPSTSGIVDIGTTLVYISHDAFINYISATGGRQDEDTELLRISASQYSNLKTLNFVIDGNTFGLTPNAQIWPRSLNEYIGGDKDSIYLIIKDIGSDTGSGLDFINGYTFLERFYSVFNSTNSRIGFATTSHTSDTSN